MFTKQERIVVLFLIGASICGLAVLYHRNFNSPPPAPKITKKPGEESRIIFVDISGAVWKPGVYKLDANCRLADVLEKAMPRKDADLNAVNRAALLKDGQKVIVPAKGNPLPRNYQKKVNINTAAQEDLLSLPQIGKVRSAEIIKYRNTHGPFKTIDELKNISGIGEQTLKQLEDHISVQ